jgi:hypothetical protein
MADGPQQRREPERHVVVEVELRHALGAIQQQAGVDILLVAAVVGECRLDRLPWQLIISRHPINIAIEGAELADERPDGNAVSSQAGVGSAAGIAIGIEIDIAVDYLLVIHRRTLPSFGPVYTPPSRPVRSMAYPGPFTVPASCFCDL